MKSMTRAQAMMILSKAGLTPMSAMRLVADPFGGQWFPSLSVKSAALAEKWRKAEGCSRKEWIGGARCLAC